MLEQMIAFFVSWFANPNPLGIGLALAFGAVWLAGYLPPLQKKQWLLGVLVGFAVIVVTIWLLGLPSLVRIPVLGIVYGTILLVGLLPALRKIRPFWVVVVVLVVSAFLSLIAVTFIQIPLQVWTGQALNNFWSQEVLMRWLLLAAIPQILYSGLVQEGSKLVPVVIYWWRKGRNIDPKLGLAIGAVAGLGFGVFEAVWVHNTIFASGWSWEAVQTGGVVALAGFWERFFTVALHTAMSAVAGYGLAKGWGWQFYLLASFLHAFANYSAVLFQSGLITIIQVEIFAAVWAMLVTGGALWLRWRKQEELAISEV